MGTLHEDLIIFLIISRSVLLITRNISDNSCRMNQNTHYIFNNIFFENRAVYEIMWKACCIPAHQDPEGTFWGIFILLDSLLYLTYVLDPYLASCL